MRPIIRLPKSLQLKLHAAASAAIGAQDGRAIDFLSPPGEQALIPAKSVSWRIFKNPIALFIGGVSAVILELANPAVRSGVWTHSSFRVAPMRRLSRTGLAAMVTIYGARSIAEPMIAAIVRRHAEITGETAAGVPFCANDTSLLNWVHSTASFSFAEAYSRYVEPLNPAEVGALYREGAPVARLYGAIDVPRSADEMQMLFQSALPSLEPSEIISEFLRIMRDAPAFPAPLRSMQRMMVGAAIEMIPSMIRARLGLSAEGLRRHEKWLVRLAGACADRIVLTEGPPSQSCLRLGLPATFLYG